MTKEAKEEFDTKGCSAESPKLVFERVGHFEVYYFFDCLRDGVKNELKYLWPSLDHWVPI